MRNLILTLSLVLCLTPLGSTAETVTTKNGSDVFLTGDTVLSEMNGQGDAFVAAETAKLGGTSLGDVHVFGFDVFVGTAIAADLYAAGATVDISAKVGSDTSAIGFSLRTSPTATMDGNVRLAGNTVTIEGPISGALSVVGRTVILNAPVGGDVRISANSLTFGDNARIDGVLSYSTPKQVAVPEQVAAADRIRYSELDADGEWHDWRTVMPRGDMPVFPTAASIFGAFLISVLFFMVLGALALGIMPKRLETMRAQISAAPGRSILLGVVGLSMLCGLVPITALTIVGLPFVPFYLLAIVVVWTLGCALGVYTAAMYLWSALGGADAASSIIRVLLLAAGIAVVALLNFIPFVGWVVNFTLVLLGIGAITRAVFARFITDIDPVLNVDMTAAID
ncbi:hypothetical protein ACEN2J_17725 [Pseudorhodobacter sp. W20_MBD10_FR17]|uniref:hypothetical protein n=1 Tax=Pseudorhodobacter sp. W20_MBD10_FR17 TaxID=3240266 RepID=UPI003F94F87F